MLVLLWGRQIWLLLQWRLAGSPPLSQGRWPSQQRARALSDESGLGSSQGQSLSRDFPSPRWVGGVWSWARRSGPGWRPGWWESRHRESCGAAVRGARGTAPDKEQLGKNLPSDFLHDDASQEHSWVWTQLLSWIWLKTLKRDVFRALTMAQV